MSMLAICGFLIGLPLIGVLGDGFTLRVGFAALIDWLVVSFVFSKQLQGR
ncbi:MAG: hypothetical protein ACI85V_002210 [bacterium]|jgi:hypothetical protein